MKGPILAYIPVSTGHALHPEVGSGNQKGVLEIWEQTFPYFRMHCSYISAGILNETGPEVFVSSFMVIRNKYPCSFL